MPSELFYSAETKPETALASSANYSAILRAFDISFTTAENYWQVGNITKIQGWIIHISVVLYQIEKALRIVVPYLKSQGIPFKIIHDEGTAEDLLNGNLGLAQIGKIVGIYPEDDANAARIAKELISLTTAFKGPFIPTDICLGNIVYARYGSFNPIIKLNAAGQPEKYIHNSKGNLIKDIYEIPFRPLEGVNWPFDALNKRTLSEVPALLNRIYKPIELLKADPKGNVFRGLYVKGLLHVKHCVIKQGFRNMFSDRHGRDIGDRLLWQFQLNKALRGVVPLPAIYDLFEEKGYTVLVMEWIKGVSLFDKIIELNPYFTCWQDLPFQKRQLILHYAIDIAQVVVKMHQKGYVHRDIVPVNFMIDKKDRITLIDIELACSINENTPNPPFTLGTYGFISPEQQAVQRPTIAEDVYGLGATLTFLFTGVYPVKFNTKNTAEFAKNLQFFIGDSQIASALAATLHEKAIYRPSVPNILDQLVAYTQRLPQSKNPVNPKQLPITNPVDFQELITVTLEGLTEPPIMIKDNLWLSKLLTAENHTSRENRQYEVSPGLANGISGVLFMLATLHENGIDINPCRRQFARCWLHLKEKYYPNILNMPPSLFNGAAGLALTIAKNIHCGLLAHTEQVQEKLVECLSLPVPDLNFANGSAGVGLAVLSCREYLPQEYYRTTLDNIVNTLLCRQRQDGLWIDLVDSKTSSVVVPNFGYDNTGVIWFLLEAHRYCPYSKLEYAIRKAIGSIINHRAYMKYIRKLVGAQESYEFGDGGKGLMITLIHSYETFKDKSLKEHFVQIMSNYPPRLAHHNFSQANGLAGVGELYIEASRVFDDQEWKSKADWIASHIANCLYKSSKHSGHWVMEQNNPSTASLLTGISGIIYFLARCWKPNAIPFRLLR